MGQTSFFPPIIGAALTTTQNHSYYLPRDFWPSYPKLFLAIYRQSPNSIPKNITIFSDLSTIAK
jgi:hypothetical protein